MHKEIGYLVGCVVLVAVLSAAGPTIVALANALAPLVLAVGLVAGVLRIVWHFTGRDRW